MPITREHAANALRLADLTGQHSRMLRGYQSAAPHLILWGCVYAATYILTFFRPQQSGIAWLVVVPLTIIGDVAIAWRDRADRRPWIVVGVPVAAFVALIVATIAIMQPHDPRQMGAFVPLAVAWAYITIGSLLGLRMIVAGIALGALTAFGYFFLYTWFLLWMAVVGGGTLVVGGIWLRQA
jgi:hypothetical protein